MGQRNRKFIRFILASVGIAMAWSELGLAAISPVSIQTVAIRYELPDLLAWPTLGKES